MPPSATSGKTTYARVVVQSRPARSADGELRIAELSGSGSSSSRVPSSESTTTVA